MWRCLTALAAVADVGSQDLHQHVRSALQQPTRFAIDLAFDANARVLNQLSHLCHAVLVAEAECDDGDLVERPPRAGDVIGHAALAGAGR